MRLDIQVRTPYAPRLSEEEPVERKAKARPFWKKALLLKCKYLLI